MTEEHPNVTLARIVCGEEQIPEQRIGVEDIERAFREWDKKAVMVKADTEALAKELAIKLAVRELEKLSPLRWSDRVYQSPAIIKNLLIGLGCEAVVKAWEECT